MKPHLRLSRLTSIYGERAWFCFAAGTLAGWGLSPAEAYQHWVYANEVDRL